MGTFVLRRFPAWLTVVIFAAYPVAAQENEDSAFPGLVEVSGFVDASYTYTNLDDSNTFGLDQVEIDLSRNLGEIGTLRADLEWVSDGRGGFNLDAEQGYVTLDLGLGRGEGNYPTLTFGKFNAPIGFELLDAPDMYQYSHALVFDRGLPTNLTGAMLSMNLGGGIDVAVHLTNGWDQNVDRNKEKTIGGRLGYNHEEMGGIGFSAMHGKQTELTGNQTVYDIDLTLTPTPELIIGGEYNKGKQEKDEHRRKFSWNGYMVMAHYRLNDVVGLTGRYDYFNVSFTHDPLYIEFWWDFPISATREQLSRGVDQHALTIAPTFALTDGLGFLMELRRDFSDEEIFEHPETDELKKSMVNFAFEMTYSF